MSISHQSDVPPLNLTIGILTWNAPGTLRNILASYVAVDWLQNAKTVVVILQGNCPKEQRIVQQFGLQSIVSEENIGIQAAIEQLLLVAKTEFFLFLENGWVCIESAQTTRQRLSEAVNLVHGGVAPCVCLRHKHYHGEPLHTLQFKGREREAHEHFLDCTHWVEQPAKEFPDIFKQAQPINADWIITNSAYEDFTNNPCFYHTRFLRQILRSYTVPSLLPAESASQIAYAAAKSVSVEAIGLDGNIQTWWREQHFSVAQGEGMFRRDSQQEACGLWPSVKRTLKRGFEKVSRRALENAPMKQIVFVCAHRESDVASVRLAVAREFERRGWNVRFLSFFDKDDAYHDDILLMTPFTRNMLCLRSMLLYAHAGMGVHH